MKRFYIIILCQILALSLFISAHFLLALYYQTFTLYIWFWCDVAFFIAIGLQILSILLFISLKVVND